MSDTRRLNVVDCREVYRGQGAKGEYVIYEVDATKEDGTPIDLPFRSFEELERGVGEFTVKPYDGKNGRSYTLSAAGQGGGGSPGARLGPKVDELRDRVETLEAQVRQILGDLDGLLPNARPAPPPAPPGAPF